MAKDIRRYELVEDTSDEEAGTMKAQMRIEEAQRMRRAREEQATQMQVRR
ncbi:oxysterol-binding protein [Paracoccus endophyticus]|nr:oxysterol-binding protein [Paracoccus endophyticus]